MSSIREVFKNFFTESKQPQQEVQNEMPTPQVRESYSGEIVDAKTVMAKPKTTKTKQVLNHLKEEGSIDSWTAIQRYGATRLSAIIFVLRKRGFNIVSIPHSVLDRNNNVCNYTNYKLQK